MITASKTVPITAQDTWVHQSTAIALRCSCGFRLMDFGADYRELINDSCKTCGAQDVRGLVWYGALRIKCKKCNKVTNVFELFRRVVTGI